MSMSQEEIEALMNDSADVAPAVEEETSAVEEVEDDSPMSSDDIAALVAQADATEEVPAVEESIEDDFLVIDDVNTEEADTVEDSSMDDILAGIDGMTDDAPEEESSSEDELPDDMDDILSGIDGMTDDAPEEQASSEDELPVDSSDVEVTLNEQIDKGVYPLPVEREHKVVNQLNEVAEDSEEKASQIFDVLSFILDENNEIQKNTKNMGEFIEKQTVLLEALSKKFPNVAAFSENLELAQNLSSASSESTSKIEEENNQIFVAMDLMQYHDINRQKIERVMSVIRKLSTYLNGIFEDDGNKPEVQIAKHISGDASDTVSNDDLDSLIAEFNN